jgi:hypothetical protein
MRDDFVKFPRTPHLFWLGDAPPRGDKLVPPAEAALMLRRPVLVEEKVDGAGIGFSVDAGGSLRVQSRGRHLERGEGGQFRPLWPWLAPRERALREGLGADLILYGEWCYARHAVGYDALPDWFLAFDVYDRRDGRFWAAERRDELVASLDLTPAPRLARGRFDRPRLERLLGRSRLGSEPMEGLYLRWEDGPWLVARAKLVRASWVPLDEQHWSARPLVPNRRRGEAWTTAGRARLA